jgi:P27 family predicted phage terminase small subunit
MADQRYSSFALINYGEDMKNGVRVPPHLSKEAKAKWKKLTKEYGISDAGGMEILRAGLEAFDRAQSSRILIDKVGLVVKDRFGAVKQNPLISCERDARAAYLQALKQLCLDVVTPHDGPGRPTR